MIQFGIKIRMQMENKNIVKRVVLLNITQKTFISLFIEIQDALIFLKVIII